MFRLPLVVAISLMWAGVAMAQPAWRTFAAAEGDLTASFPGAPVVSTPTPGPAILSQRTYALEAPPAAYNISVMVYPKAALPAAPTVAYYTPLMTSFAEGSGTKLRALTPLAFAGRSGAQGVFDDPETGSVMVLRLVVVGDKLFSVVYGGPKGSDTGADARQFLDSVRIGTR
jgi:hypothetical protein